MTWVWTKNKIHGNEHKSNDSFSSKPHFKALGDLREKFSRERSGQRVSLLNHLKQGLLPWNS